MKISIELDRFSLQVLTAFSAAFWAAFGGGAEVVFEVISLYLIIKG